MFVNVIKTYRDVVAVCDSELLGMKFEEGKFQLDVKESFYKGKELDEKQAIKVMKQKFAEDATFNIVGKKSINAALSAGIIFEESIGKIKGIPFAMLLT
ncbi:DUF424 domain-containing protein [Candidatus Pacearchaeota archaeon CG10_big_fil_rev_8_21_14_0_10_34_12]|nr:MAG: DUF424 domain-containing protein [Candidatus Pacearchaeota archaeon CG10_big_fil_rev_8_21_14_0_10_34_12]